MASRITWADKTDPSGKLNSAEQQRLAAFSATEKLSHTDTNQVKAVVNSHADVLDANVLAIPAQTSGPLAGFPGGTILQLVAFVAGGTVPAEQRPLRIDGHSINTNYAAESDPDVSYYLQQRLGSAFTDFKVIAIHGQTAAQMLGRLQNGGPDEYGGPAYVGSTLPDRTGMPFGVDRVYGALNSLDYIAGLRAQGNTAAANTAMDALKTTYSQYGELAASKNWRCVYVEEAASQAPTYSADRNRIYFATIMEWNDWLRANFASLNGYGLVRLPTDSKFATPAATLNAAIYTQPDRTHFVGAGRDRDAELSAPVLTQVSAGASNVIGVGDLGAAGAVPTITSLSPSTAAVGATVEVNGTWLSGTQTVTVNGTAATFTVVNENKLSITVPVGATSGNVVVTTPVSTASRALTVGSGGGEVTPPDGYTGIVAPGTVNADSAYLQGREAWTPAAGGIYSANTANTLTINFFGVGFRFFSLSNSGLGSVEISIDNGAFQTVSVNSPTDQDVSERFYSGVLTRGAHTAVIRPKSGLGFYNYSTVE